MRARQDGSLSRRNALALAAALVAVLSVTISAWAAIVNPGFEDGLNGWTATIHPPAGDPPFPATCVTPLRDICVVNGGDSFPITEEGTTRTVTISPFDGTRDARLAGPFENNAQRQELDTYVLEQSLTVDPADPVLHLVYNFLTFDYTGFDQLVFEVRRANPDGSPIEDALIAQLRQGGFGISGDTSFKMTDWRPAAIDLSGYVNELVHLRITLRGTTDTLYGSWAYIDSGTLPSPPVGAPTGGAPPGVSLDVETDPLTGRSWFIIPAAQQGECTGLTINVPIAAGSGVVSDVFLIHGGAPPPIAMVDPEGDGVWTATDVPCVDGDLAVQYKLTEGGSTETFIVPIGGIALIDPQGVVYELARYDAAIVAGKTPDQARAESALSGATVELQRQGADTVYRKVLSGDPGITPNVNPQTTGANGRYQWDVSAGVYRVVVNRAGFNTVTSREVTIPPPVLDLHVPLGPPGPQPQPQPQPPAPQPQPQPPAPPPPPQPRRPRAAVRCVVPNVKGKTIARARSLLRARRCALGRVSRTYSARVRQGRIIKQNRRPGARLARGTRVNVVVSRGRRR